MEMDLGDLPGRKRFLEKYPIWQRDNLNVSVDQFS
jgi:hypothetical protein